MPATKKVGGKNAIVYSYENGLLKSQTDAMGNTATAETVLRVYAYPVTAEQVYAAVDVIIARETTPDMTKAQKENRSEHF